MYSLLFVIVIVVIVLLFLVWFWPTNEGYTNNDQHPVITYNLIGGIAGLNDEWKIFSDGAVLKTDKDNNVVKRQISDDDMKKIKHLLKSINYSKYAGNYETNAVIYDAFNYVITIYPNIEISFKDAEMKLPGEVKKLQNVIENAISE